MYVVFQVISDGAGGAEKIVQIFPFEGNRKYPPELKRFINQRFFIANTLTDMEELGWDYIDTGENSYEYLDHDTLMCTEKHVRFHKKL